MGAFNFIRIESQCPACKNESEILCQTHIASDYDGNSEVGRFHDHEYKLGQKMPWFEDDYESWYSHNDWKVSDSVAREACISSCLSCNAEIYVLIEFQDITPKKVVSIGLEHEMPKQFL